jgi:pimeloyl-ACP methyl ester carboxylesterase
MLSATGHEPPYVLVGHSLGGTLMELLARTHPDEVAGVVLVDSRPAGFTERCEVFDVAGCAPSGDVLDAAPEPVRSEALALQTTEEQVQAAPPLGELPAAVIAAEASSGDPQTDALWLEVQRELAADLGVELVVADGSGHNVQHERPDLVTDVIVGLLGQL